VRFTWITSWMERAKVEVEPTRSASRPRAVVGYGIKNFVPRPLHCVTRSPGGRYLEKDKPTHLPQSLLFSFLEENLTIDFASVKFIFMDIAFGLIFHGLALVIIFSCTWLRHFFFMHIANVASVMFPSWTLPQSKMVSGLDNDPGLVFLCTILVWEKWFITFLTPKRGLKKMMRKGVLNLSNFKKFKIMIKYCLGHLIYLQSKVLNVEYVYSGRCA